jgi:hypothetical protein
MGQKCCVSDKFLGAADVIGPSLGTRIGKQLVQEVAGEVLPTVFLCLLIFGCLCER